jgi:hypothetical protein
MTLIRLSSHSREILPIIISSFVRQFKICFLISSFCFKYSKFNATNLLSNLEWLDIEFVIFCDVIVFDTEFCFNVSFLLFDGGGDNDCCGNDNPGRFLFV